MIHLVTSMPCLIALVKTDNFTEGMEFVDYIQAVPENSFRRKKKHVVLLSLTKIVDYGSLTNRSGNYKLHIISQNEAGILYFNILLCLVLPSCLI